MHFKTFKDFINESIETIVDEPTASGVFAKIKKNKGGKKTSSSIGSPYKN